MEPTQDTQRHDLVLGATLILAGAALLSGWMAFADFGRLWPLFLIAAGLARVVGPRDGRQSGVWLLFAGTVFLLDKLRILSLSKAWPLALVVLGASKVSSAWTGGAEGREVHRVQ